MTLFRAIAASKLSASAKGLTRQTTIRVPSNVPYVVDNLWESLRPESMPSRRHAIYASPTPELALQNASAPLDEGDHYLACRVLVKPEHIRVAQLQVSDARHHSDIKLISKYISRIGAQLANLTMEEKHQISPFFMPGLSSTEMTVLLSSNGLIADLFKQIQENSTFWSSASASISEASDGELFFELVDDTVSCTLEAI